ncbi:MAG: hypothetical protein ABSE22_17240 [Xanthobacteraceae bacterium]
MSDYRDTDFDYQYPEDPFGRHAKPGSKAPGVHPAWAWIAAALFVVIALAVVFDIGHRPGHNATNTASNEVTPPLVSHIPPPAPMPAPTMAPAPAVPATPLVPMTPAR